MLSPDYTVREWSKSNVKEWIVRNFDDEDGSFANNLKSYNGDRLLNIDLESNALIDELISNESSKSKFINHLSKLKRIQEKFDSSKKTFVSQSDSLLEMSALLISNSDHYGWILYAINNMSPIISNIYKNLTQFIPISMFDEFHTEISNYMNQILPIITSHLEKRKSVSGKSQNLLYFVLNALSWSFNSRKYDDSKINIMISTKVWLESKLLQEILNKFEDSVLEKPDYIVSCALLMVIASFASYSTLNIEFNKVLSQLNISTIMYHFVCIYNTSLNDIQISFPFRTILYLDGSKNKEIEWIIENTNAINAIIKEFHYGLSKKCVNDVFNYYPDAWDRAIAINILCDNNKYKQILIEKDIMYYLKKALMIHQNTKVETSRLHKNILSILIKITKNTSNFKHFYKYFNPKRYIYYDGDRSRCFWNRLNWLRLNSSKDAECRICSESSEMAQTVFDNVHKYYYQLFQHFTLIHHDLITEIIYYLW